MRAMSRRWAPGSERPHPMAGRSVRASGAAYLLASLAILFYLASGGASRACGSVRCTAGRLCFAEPLTVGSVRAGALRPVLGCNGVFALR